MLNDDANCGGCGVACASGQTCQPRNAAYVCQCNGTVSDCGNGVCADLTSDEANCGACGNVCPSGSTWDALCYGGDCFGVCMQNRGDCDGLDFNGCEATLNDSGSCGPSCDTAVGCGWNDSCVSAPLNHCRCDDGNECNPGERCVSDWNGVDHCECGTNAACSAGQFCCEQFLGRYCADVLTDAQNCGDCGWQCNAGETCVAGICQ